MNAASGFRASFGSRSCGLCRKVAAPQLSRPARRVADRRQQELRAVATAAPFSVRSEKTVTLPGISKIESGVSKAVILRHVHMAGAAAQGLRPSMEDTHFTTVLHPELVNQPAQHSGATAHHKAEVAAAAVFDGHAGSSTAEQALRHTPQLLQAAVMGQHGTAGRGPRVSCTGTLPPASALSASLQAFDSWWCDAHGSDRSGSTAVMGLVAGEQLCVANTGDCVALLAHHGSSRRLSVDHRADNAAELMRVLTAGGEVDYDERGTLRVYRPNDHFRLNGAMFTRSLGDFHFKTPVPLLTSEPHVTQHQLTPADRLVLLTSDGVTDVLPDDDVIELAFRAVEKARHRTDDGQQLAQAAATEVMCAALRSHSGDNVTAVAMLLDWS